MEPGIEIRPQIEADPNGELFAALMKALIEEEGRMYCRSAPDGQILEINQEFCRYFNQTRDELIGSRYFPKIHPDDQAAIDKHLDDFTPENPIHEIEHRIILPNQKTRWHRWKDIALFDEKGNIREFHSIGNDITRQKERDFITTARMMQFELVGTRIQTFYWTINEAGKITSFGGSGLKRFHMDSEIFLGQDLAELLGADETHPLVQAHQDALRGKRSSFGIELWKKDFFITIDAHQDEMERIIGSVGVMWCPW